MRNYSFLLMGIMLLFASCTLLQAQDLSKYYTQRVQDPNDLFFIHPFEEFEAADNKSPLSFDITYLQGKDSVVLNYTYYSKDPMPSDSLGFVSGDRIFTFPASRIYEDYVKKEWENRFQVKIPFDELPAIFKSDVIPEIHIVGSDKVRIYSVKEKKWNSYAGAVDKILYIIQSANR